MTSALETQWQSQADRRRRIIRLMLFVFGVLGVLVALSWFWLTQPLFSNPVRYQLVSVDPTRLQSHVQALSVQFSPRDESHVENLDRAAAYIRAEFEKAGARAAEQAYQVGGKTYHNVIAQIGPETKERIVVGAHYDVAGPLPGADDNASGVAGLIELAYLLSRQRPAVMIELVAYSLEEPPYFRSEQMGSSVHATSLKRAGVKVRAMFSLEMIGYFSDAPGSQKFPTPILAALYPSQGNFISVVGRVRDGLLVRRVKGAMLAGSALPVYSINAPDIVPGLDFSDHLNYWNVGYPAIMITDTAFYRNHNYHSAQDTSEKLDFKRMGMVVEGVDAALLKLAVE